MDSLCVDEDDESEEEEKEWIGVLQVNIPYVEHHVEVTGRGEHTAELQHRGSDRVQHRRARLINFICTSFTMYLES